MLALQIGLVADKNFYQGALLTIGSALRRIPGSKPVILHGIFIDWLPRQVEHFRSAVRRWHPICDLCIHDFEMAAVAEFRKVRGSFANYGLFMLPSLVEGRLLYLDCDLLVRIDLSPVFDFDLGPAIAAAVSWETLCNSADKKLFVDLGIPLTSPHFNCGVMLIDCERWQKQEVTAKSLALRSQYNGMLIGGNQPVLNAMLHGRMCSLPRIYNTPVSPHRRLDLPTRRQPRVWHLTGRPKPWEFLGKALHCLGPEYSDEEKALGLDRQILRQTLFRGLFTLLRHWRGYCRCIRAKLGK